MRTNFKEKFIVIYSYGSWAKKKNDSLFAAIQTHPKLNFSLSKKNTFIFCYSVNFDYLIVSFLHRLHRFQPSLPSTVHLGQAAPSLRRRTSIVNDLRRPSLSFVKLYSNNLKRIHMLVNCNLFRLLHPHAHHLFEVLSLRKPALKINN